MVAGLALPALPGQAVITKYSVHCGLRTQVDTLVEQRRPHLGDARISEPVRAQHSKDSLLFTSVELRRVSTTRLPRGTRRPDGKLTGLFGPMMTPRTRRNPERRTRCPHADTTSPRFDVMDQLLREMALTSIRRSPCNAKHFPWTATNSSNVAIFDSARAS